MISHFYFRLIYTRSSYPKTRTQNMFDAIPIVLSYFNHKSPYRNTNTPSVVVIRFDSTRTQRKPPRFNRYCLRQTPPRWIVFDALLSYRRDEKSVPLPLQESLWIFSIFFRDVNDEKIYTFYVINGNGCVSFLHVSGHIGIYNVRPRAYKSLLLYTVLLTCSHGRDFARAATVIKTIYHTNMFRLLSHCRDDH